MDDEAGLGGAGCLADEVSAAAGGPRRTIAGEAPAHFGIDPQHVLIDAAAP